MADLTTQMTLKAKSDFERLIDELDTIEEVTEYVQALCAMSCLAINGTKGYEFKAKFLAQAIIDKSKLEIKFNEVKIQ
jgi:hypothetical protein